MKNFFYNNKFDKPNEFLNKSNIYFIYSFQNNSLNFNFIYEYLLEINKSLEVNSFNYLEENYSNEPIKEFKRIKPDLSQRYSFKIGNRIDISFFRPYHSKIPPDEILIEVDNNNNFSESQLIFKKLYDLPGFTSLFVINKEYFQLQGKKKLSYYRNANLLLNSLKYKTDEFTNTKIIDVTRNPGRSEVIENTWIMPGWKMLFGVEFFKYVSKYKLLNYKKAIKNEEIDNNKVMIQLYEDVFEPHYSYNIKVQRDFLKYIQFNELVNKYKYYKK